MSKITKYLNQLITGNTFDASEVLEKYSVDHSALQITPKIVALPESTEDIQKLMQFFTQLAEKGIRVPVAVRGSGLDETGADLTTGLVISMEKLNHLEEIDTRERLVRVQAGITLKELNTALKVSGLVLPIKANENETIGSLIANCPTDSYAAKYGGIMNFIERAEFVLANGECVQTNRISGRSINKKVEQGTLEGSIYDKILNLAKNNAEAIQQIHSNKISQAGYPNLAYAARKESVDLMPLLFGSNGTLGIISEVILRAEVIKPAPERLITSFSTLKSTINFLTKVAELKPLELNVVDLRILKIAEERGKNLSEITRKLQSGYAVYVSFDEKGSKASHKIRECLKYIASTSSYILESEKNAPLLNEFENSITSYLHSTTGGERLSLLSNFYIPSKNFVSFIKDTQTIEEKLKMEMPVFGSFITSNYSIRPSFRLSDPQLDNKIPVFLKAGNLIITRNEGSLAGGSAEGRIKAIITNNDLSDTEKSIYKELKKAFDPQNIMNPDAKLGANLKNTLPHLRTVKTPKIML